MLTKLTFSFWKILFIIDGTFTGAGTCIQCLKIQKLKKKNQPGIFMQDKKPRHTAKIGKVVI